MHEQICAFPSQTLYSSKLKSHPSVASRLLRDLPETKAESEEDENYVLSTPVVFFDTAGCEYFERLDGDGDEGSRCNENEAAVVKEWVEKLVRSMLYDRLNVWTYNGSVLDNRLATVYNPLRLRSSHRESPIENDPRATGSCLCFDRYQAQVTLLTSLLRPLCGPQLEIGTVDGMQGREKEAVVISLVRSNEKASHDGVSMGEC